MGFGLSCDKRIGFFWKVKCFQGVGFAICLVLVQGIQAHWSLRS